MSKERIDLPNRYREHIYLEQDDNGDWWLTGDGNALAYHRVIFSEDGSHKIHAIDPSGGPFLCIGYVVGDKTVTDIEFIKDKGYKVTLKPLHNETH